MMNPRIKEIKNQFESFGPFIKQIKSLFADMDLAYQKVADDYGFVCRGCEDNCCSSRFSHHTLLEFIYLSVGFRQLTVDIRTEILNQAHRNIEKGVKTDQKDTDNRLMCPVNVNEQCLLYPFRPMICRLHGIPHELKLPDNSIQYGQGCEAFTSRCKESTYIPFNRTPLYTQLSCFEIKLRQKIGVFEKIKMTVAEMLIL